MELKFPYQGLHEGVPTEAQPPLTSPHVVNVRPFATQSGRLGGGKRPGLVKAFSTQVGGNHPVIAMCQIATTYIEPETI